MSRKLCQVQVYTCEDWRKIAEMPRGWCMGFLQRQRESPGPKLAMRVVDSSGRVADESPGSDKVSLGMIAGFPTAEQYQRAGNEALRRAHLIRERDGEQARRKRDRVAAREARLTSSVERWRKPKGES